MFENEVSEALSNLSYRHKCEFYVLTHKKHKREMYFRKGDKNCINFVKPKFKGFKKGLIHLMLRLGILQPFLKKVLLPVRFGSLILVGGQIKTFNFEEGLVYSFTHSQYSKDSKWDESKFIIDKSNQSFLAPLGFAPRVNFLDEHIPYSIEELCKPYDGPLEPVIDKLLEFYKKFPGRIHGEFALEQVVEKNGKIMFVDWDLRHGDWMEDIRNMFRFREDYENSPEYKMIMKKFTLSKLKGT